MIEVLVLLPLITATFVGIFSRKIEPDFAQKVTCGGLIISAILSFYVFIDVAILKNLYHESVFRWVDIGSFKVNWVLRVDSLTAVMLVLVTWVSALVHIYSVGYMEHDPHKQRFMAYLSLFTFFMLMLVTSDNFIQLFFGWEGVGLCSYLLIGFWYKKESACNAAIKAFVVNRVGDFAFLLGIFSIYLLFDTVVFREVFSLVPSMTEEVFNIFGHKFHALTVVCILLFIGAMGKSAQLGLHTWLPDAMEGPTPVSALIHAATMVTAGVFLVARCSPIFEHSEFALHVVTIVGGLTAIFAATVAITQNDIKKVIAYSTCSQLGYMFFACGVSAYAAGVFHLMTHGFFKALLFLGAGSVIHALSDEQDLRKMGGVWKKIPYTYSMMWIGSLALVGIFPFAGFYSKDIILEAAYAEGGMGSFAFYLGIMAAFLTAFYSWRLIIMAFHGKAKFSKEVLKNIHESPSTMMVPLILLSFGAFFAGIIGYYGLGMVDQSAEFWMGAIYMLPGKEVYEEAHHVPAIIKLLPLIVGILGISLAYLLYMFYPKTPAKIAKIFKPIYLFLYNKWYFDEIYNLVLVKPIIKLGKICWTIGDEKVIDGCGPNGIASFSQKIAIKVRQFQSGYIYSYAFVMIVGALILMNIVIFSYLIF